MSTQKSGGASPENPSAVPPPSSNLQPNQLVASKIDVMSCAQFFHHSQTSSAVKYFELRNYELIFGVFEKE